MTYDTLRTALDCHPWADRLVVLDTIDSTNTYAKTLAVQGAAHGTVVLADHQTGGRGRLGRSFASPRGKGVYLSAILRYDVPPSALMHLTCMAAEAVRRAVSGAAGLDCGIKWTNDLVVGKKKLCGILTELVSTSQGFAVIVGAGVNCSHLPEDFPPEVASMATSLLQCGCPTDRSTVAAAMIRQLSLADRDMLSPGPWMDSYRRHCVTLGQDVKILRGEEVRYAHVDGMDDQGALLVTLSDGTQETVFSGEVSVRGMYGYL